MGLLQCGADKPEAYGGYYAWGETETKSAYTLSTYIHYSDSYDTCYDLGSDIAGTEYDVAHVKWGGSWVMPSREQQDELSKNCSYTWTKQNGVSGSLFTGSNGGSIFLPAAGFCKDSDFYAVGSSGFYWSSSQDSSGSNTAFSLFFNSLLPYTTNYYRYNGHSVRPVVRN